MTQRPGKAPSRGKQRITPPPQQKKKHRGAGGERGKLCGEWERRGSPFLILSERIGESSKRLHRFSEFPPPKDGMGAFSQEKLWVS